MSIKKINKKAQEGTTASYDTIFQYVLWAIVAAALTWGIVLALKKVTG